MALASVQNLYDASGTQRLVLGEREISYEADWHQYFNIALSAYDASGNTRELGYFEAPGIRMFQVGIEDLYELSTFKIQCVQISNGIIEISFNTSALGKIIFEVYSLTGKSIWSGQTNINTTNNSSFKTDFPLTSGIYILKTTHGNGAGDVLKISIP